MKKEKKTDFRLKAFGIFLITSLVLPLAQAEEVDVLEFELRSQCFEDLKAELLPINSLREAAQKLSALDYDGLEGGFSKRHEILSSGGIDLDEALFGIRFYDFGPTTNYRYPPVSPFPVYTNAALWDTPVKQHVVLEEYVKTPEGRWVFTGCGYVKANAPNLRNVDAGRHLYDGDMVSLLRADGDFEPRVWYGEYPSYDHDDQVFVTWQKLFVYPPRTQNLYFDRYQLADNFPAYMVLDFGLLEGRSLPNYFLEQKGVVDADPFLRPFLNQDGFSLFESYYNAIEQRFPSFSRHLSIRGALSYENYKKIKALSGIDDLAFVEHAILNGRTLTRYMANRENGESPSVLFYDRMIRELGYVDQKVEQILALHAPPIEASVVGSPDEVLEAVDPVVDRPDLSVLSESNKASGGIGNLGFWFALGAFGLALLLILAFMLHKSKHIK